MDSKENLLRRIKDHLDLADRVYRGNVDTHGWAETYLQDVKDLLKEREKSNG